jgi:hypothetical protein
VGNGGGDGELIDVVSRRAMAARFKIGVVAWRFGWLRRCVLLIEGGFVASRNGSVMPCETQEYGGRAWKKAGLLQGQRYSWKGRWRGGAAVGEEHVTLFSCEKHGGGGATRRGEGFGN